MSGSALKRSRKPGYRAAAGAWTTYSPPSKSAGTWSAPQVPPGTQAPPAAVQSAVLGLRSPAPRDIRRRADVEGDRDGDLGLGHLLDQAEEPVRRLLAEPERIDRAHNRVGERRPVLSGQGPERALELIGRGGPAGERRSEPLRGLRHRPGLL